MLRTAVIQSWLPSAPRQDSKAFFLFACVILALFYEVDNTVLEHRKAQGIGPVQNVTGTRLRPSAPSCHRPNLCFSTCPLQYPDLLESWCLVGSCILQECFCRLVSLSTVSWWYTRGLLCNVSKAIIDFEMSVLFVFERVCGGG